ncbi:MAG: hypothetical protein WA985_03625 [Erythrobacter sp.]|uniref:hypothetical protein n=1 Tax=Erythrobacter sp. TaxID=1042 RepID=UPI003C70A716
MSIIAAIAIAANFFTLAPFETSARAGTRIDLAEERAAIRQFQMADQKLQDIGFRLAHHNAGFCERVVPSVGLQLQDLASYGQPEIARVALELAGDFAVQTAARGSPAYYSGAFEMNREIARIGRVDPNAWDADDRLDWQRLTRAHDHVERLLAERGRVAVDFADGSRVELKPVPVCATRFELASDSGRAVADGERVVIGMKFKGFRYDEARFAGVVAHELAHNVLGHREWLDRNGRSVRNIRMTEREADRLMPWLMANAGYDPQAAVDFMTSWGPWNDGWIFRGPTHDGWDERAEFIGGEIPVIRDLIAVEGRADWSAYFRREIDPDARQEH